MAYNGCMNRLSLSSAVWSDPRFASLQEATGWGRAQTIGTLVVLWDATRQKDRGTLVSHDGMMRAVLGAWAEKERTLAALLEAGYVVPAEGHPDKYVLPDNASYFEHVRTFQHAGSKGGMATAAKAKKAVKRAPKPAADPQCGAAWAAYADAYQARYRVPPVRNAKVNALIKQFVARVGAQAGAVLRFYVQHNDGQYVQSQHNLSLAVRDAEGLCTQHQRGQAVTRASVYQTEKQDRLGDQMRRLQAGAAI